jgi:hypothetical protein
MSDKQLSGALTVEALQAILEANNKQQAENTLRLIEAIRKPADLTPEQKATIEQDKQIRQATALMEVNKQNQRHLEQKFCPHRHDNGKSATVSVNMGEFLICVKCQAKIKNAKGPNDEPEQGFIVDENLYWTHANSQQQTTF